MGYAKPVQTAHGIHTRLRARAFIVSERPHKDEERQMDTEEIIGKEEADAMSSSLSSLKEVFPDKRDSRTLTKVWEIIQDKMWQD